MSRPGVDRGERATDDIPSMGGAVLLPCSMRRRGSQSSDFPFKRCLGRNSYVYDNNSSDRTIAVARGVGAQCATSSARAKGHVGRRPVADIDADIYVLVERRTRPYDAAALRRMTLAGYRMHL